VLLFRIRAAAFVLLVDILESMFSGILALLVILGVVAAILNQCDKPYLLKPSLYLKVLYHRQFLSHK
jgi:hypothetical protein